MKKILCGLLTAVAILIPASIAQGTGGGGSGSGFLLGGTAQNAQDPENPANDVIRVDTTNIPPECSPVGNYTNCPFGTVSRTLNVKITALDNQLEWKSYFVAPKTCIGGSPRMQLAIDLNGDGTSDGNAHGAFGPGPYNSGCVSNQWVYQDLTDNVGRWDVTQFLVSGLTLPPLVDVYNVPWSVLETVLTTQFPNHLVCTGQLTDDAYGPPPPGMAGIAYYDLISIGNDNWNKRQDTAGRGFAMGCGRPDHGDDDEEGDYDRDHRHNHQDDEFNDHRQQHYGGH